MAQVVHQSGAVIINSGPEPPRNKCCHYATAVLSFLTGGGCFILGIVVIATLPAANWARDSATGIWVGGIIAFTGMMGVASTWKHENKVLRGFYIFLGVISCILSFVAVIIFIVATLYYAITLDCGFQKGVNVWTAAMKAQQPNFDNCDKKNLAVGLHVTMMLFCGFEFIVSIVGACLACACCCGGSSRQTVVVAPQPMAVIPQQGYPQQHPNDKV